MSAPQSVFAGLVQEASELLKGGHSFGDLIGLAGLLAGRVNTLTHLTGPQKKNLVVEVLEHAVRASVPSELREETLLFIQRTVPSVLDVAIEIGRGRIDLRKPADLKVGCFALGRLLLSCVQAKAKSPAGPVLTALAPPRESVHQEEVVVESVPVTEEADDVPIEDVLRDSVCAPVPEETEKQVEEEVQTKSEAPPNEA